MKIKKCLREAVDEAEEDALSLCDLPIYSSASEWEKFSCESQGSSSVSSSESSESEFFEFFSEEWNKPASSNLLPEKIMFCGKVIPRKDPVPENDEKSEKNKQGNFRRTRSPLSLFSRTRRSRKDSSMSNEEPNSSTLPAESKVLGLRESEPLSPLWRSRWFLFLFGMAGFPKQMDLKDIKNRQSRKTPSSPPSTEGRGNRLWWMIRALSCGGGGSQVHAQAIVKASIGCIAQM